MWPAIFALICVLRRLGILLSFAKCADHAFDWVLLLPLDHVAHGFRERFLELLAVPFVVDLLLRGQSEPRLGVGHVA